MLLKKSKYTIAIIIDEETEAQRGKMTLFRSQHKEGERLGMNAISQDSSSSELHGAAPKSLESAFHSASVIHHPFKLLCLCTCSFLCLRGPSQLLLLACVCSFITTQPYVSSSITRTLLLSSSCTLSL